MNMITWLNELKNHKRTIPILSFPAIQLMDCSLNDFLNDSTLQAQGMALVTKRCKTGVGIGMMDLSIEAECFGAQIKYEEDNIPTVVGSLVEDSAEFLEVPDVYSGRAKIYIETISKAKSIMENEPVLAGMIGPFSLAGRLLDVTEAMILCYEDPDLVHDVLDKSTQFLIEYGKALKKAGANGLIMAEPLAGILSPTLVQEFSSDYVKEIVDALQDDEFIIIYHNCGNNVLKMTDSIISTNCSAYHFGNAINMKDMLERMPRDKIIMGNIDPVGVLKDGTLDLIQKTTKELLEECYEFDNFVLSSGCDVPHSTSWGNIDCFINTGNQYYEK
jgi:uroporphyrinogen decarboxylase